MRAKLLTALFVITGILLTSCSQSPNLTFKVKHKNSFICAPPELYLLSALSKETTSLPFIPPVCQVEKIYVRTGDRVKKGEVVARLSSQFIERLVAVQERKIDLERQKLELMQLVPIFVPFPGNPLKVQDAQKKVIELDEEVKNQLEKVKEKFILKALTDGVVVDAAKEGEVVYAGQPVVILERNSAKIYAYADESDLRRLRNLSLYFKGTGMIKFKVKPEVKYIPGEYVFNDFKVLKGAEVFAYVSSTELKNAEIINYEVRKDGVK